MQQSELPAGRNFEDRPALRIRLSFLGHFAYAAKAAVRRLDDVVGAAAAWTFWNCVMPKHAKATSCAGCALAANAPVTNKSRKRRTSREGFTSISFLSGNFDKLVRRVTCWLYPSCVRRFVGWK